MTGKHTMTADYASLGVQIRKDSDAAFENAIRRGMRNPENWMYMYSKNGRDYFKHEQYRTYKSYPQSGGIRNRERER